MAKHAIYAALLFGLLLATGLFAQPGGSGSDWQYCNAFNVVDPFLNQLSGTGLDPYGPPGGTHDQGDSTIPSWYTTDFSNVATYTPTSWVRRRSYKWNTPMTGEEPVRMCHEENVVLRLDLLSGTDNVELRGVKLTLFGSPDFNPNEDLAPIHPESTAIHYSVPLIAADTLTGVQFYIDKGVSAQSDVNILDRKDIIGIAEQLITDTLIQNLDTYSPTDPAHREVTLLEANYWDADSVSTDPSYSGWKWWSATFYFEDAINIPYEGTFQSDLYGLPFYRIWIALQMAGCHECGDGIGGIEGISNADSFYVEIAERSDLICFRYNPPLIDSVDMAATLTDVIYLNAMPTEPPTSPTVAMRWSRSELLWGWDEIEPLISQLWPRNLISTNGPYSDSTLCDEVTDSIYTADEQQPISITTQDFGTCVDSAFMEIRYLNDYTCTCFPYRIDSIIWHDTLEFADDSGNSGNAVGWEWKLKHTDCSGSPGWTAWGQWSEAFATWTHPPCGLDSFVVMVGNDTLGNTFPMFDDGAYVQVTFRAFSRTHNPHSLSVPGVMNDTVWTFIVDLSGPIAEMECPDYNVGYSPDDLTIEFAAIDRYDVIEGQDVYWTWLADSLPTIRLRFWDDFNVVHDSDNHDLGAFEPSACGYGGAGINWRDFEIMFIVEHCDYSRDTLIVNELDIGNGVWIDEDSTKPAGQWEKTHPDGYSDGWMWINFEELVNFHAADPEWIGVVPFASGDFIWVVLTELVDDPDYGQRWDAVNCMINDWGLTPVNWNDPDSVIDPYPSDPYPLTTHTWGEANGADGNYGTQSYAGKNHIPVMWEVTAPPVCGYYDIYAQDTLGVLHIDLEGPTAPDTFYYPPDQWVTSDTFQVITCDIFDQIGCDFDYGITPNDDPNIYPRVSGVYAGWDDEEARICMNIKVRGCDGSWHPYYHGLMPGWTEYHGTIPDGRNFCWGDDHRTTIDDTIFLSQAHFTPAPGCADAYGVRVTYDPYYDYYYNSYESRFRPGDKVCVTVYAWDNAVTACQSVDGLAGPGGGFAWDNPWDDENDPWVGDDDLYCGTGTVAHNLTYYVPSRNEGVDKLDPDWLYYTKRQIARWNFYVDAHPPEFVEADMEQVCNDTMSLHFRDVAKNWRDDPCYCEDDCANFVANIGIQHGELVEGADLMLIFTDTMTTPGVTYVDTVIWEGMKLSGGAYPADVHVAYHGIPGREYQYYYAELKKDTTDCCAAYVILYGDGTNSTCHFFQPYDHIDWQLYAGDSPDVPWWPATYRCVSGPAACYNWEHKCDPYWGDAATFWRCSTFAYYETNIDTLDVIPGYALWRDTIHCDFENPNWALIQTGEFDILPETWLNRVTWYNDGAYDGYPGGPWNYPPDLKGDYDNVRANWTGYFYEDTSWVFGGPNPFLPDTIYQEGDPEVYSEYETDPYVDFWVNELNYMTVDLYTCTDSIIWECLVGSNPDDDTLPFKVPHVVIELFGYDESEGYTHVWTLDEYYDCHCTPCFLNYQPMRTACLDWGVLHIGPFDQTEQWLTTARDTIIVEDETTYVYGWEHLDSISVMFEFCVREPHDFTDPEHFTKHVFRWSYVVDMMPPTARWRDPDATTGYNEVNCDLIHDSNHDIRLRLENIYDENVGCANGVSMAPGWATAWPIPAVDPTSDLVIYELGTLPPVDANMIWAPAPSGPHNRYLWLNENFVIGNCSPEDQVADTMTLFPEIYIYHGIDYAADPDSVTHTNLLRDTIFYADSIFAEAIIQDRLGNSWLKTSRKIALDNGLPEVKGFALATGQYDGDLGEFWLENWDSTKFKLPWDPDTSIWLQDSLVGIYNFTPVCTVYVRLWFNDNMDMREADHLFGHIVRFQPFGWTHWFPILPLETVSGSVDPGLHFPLSNIYVDYRDIEAVYPDRKRPAPESGNNNPPTDPANAEALDNGWNSDREWIGYLVLAGDGAMDGVGKLRIQGFDDNAGNYMMPVEFPIRVVTGQPWGINIEWPRLDNCDEASNDALVLTGWSTDEPWDSTECNFLPDTGQEGRYHPITGYWDNYLAETDSVRFLIWWHDEQWTGGDISYEDYTFYWSEDNMYSGFVTIYNETTWVTMPPETLDVLHYWCPSLGTQQLYANEQKYMTIIMETFSRFRPVNPYMADTLINVLIDNSRPDPDLTSDGGGEVVHPCYTVLPFGSTDLRVCWDGKEVEQWEKMSIWLHNLIDMDTDYMLFPEGGLPGKDFGAVGTGGLTYSGGQVCLDYSTMSGLPAGMWTVSWQAFDAIHVVDTALSCDYSEENYWTYYHVDCEIDCEDEYVCSDTLVILRPPFLARGDDLCDALLSVADNFPSSNDLGNDIFPWWDASMEQLWPDWPTWGYVDDPAIGAIDTLPTFYRVEDFQPILQITTFNNPDPGSDPFLDYYDEGGDFPDDDSLYILLEQMPTDVNIDYIVLNIADYWGGNISGSNLEITVTLDSSDVYECNGRYFWAYKWTVDDQDNRYDGLVTLTATEHTWSDVSMSYHDWDHVAYILLDTYDPSYSVSMVRAGAFEELNRAINPIDYPAEEYIWVVNADNIIVSFDWDETIFDPGGPDDPLAYFNYGDYIYARMWDYLRLTIDGMPHYGYEVNDPNDHLEARLWDDDLDVWDIHNPFWRQPDFIDGATNPSSYDEALGFWSFGNLLDWFGDDIYEYEWDIAGAPEGLDAQGICYLLVKGRDAAGNILDYEEARISDAVGKLALVDIEAPEIDSAEIVATGEAFTGYAGAFDDNFLGDNFTDLLGNGYVYIVVTDDVGDTLGPVMWVDPTGAVVTTAWGATAPVPGDVVTVCAYDLAGNFTCQDIDVVPEMHQCEYVVFV